MSEERVHRLLDAGWLAVLDFNPVRRSGGPIAAAVFRDEAFKTHQAGVAADVGPLARYILEELFLNSAIFYFLRRVDDALDTRRDF